MGDIDEEMRAKSSFSLEQPTPNSPLQLDNVLSLHLLHLRHGRIVDLRDANRTTDDRDDGVSIGQDADVV